MSDQSSCVHVTVLWPTSASQITSKATDQVLPGLSHKRFSFDTEADVLGITSGKKPRLVTRQALGA